MTTQQNGHLIKWQVIKMTIQKITSAKWHFSKMTTQQNDKSTKWQVNKMTGHQHDVIQRESQQIMSWHNDQVGKKASWWNVNLTKWEDG